MEHNVGYFNAFNALGGSTGWDRSFDHWFLLGGCHLPLHHVQGGGFPQISRETAFPIRSGAIVQETRGPKYGISVLRPTQFELLRKYAVGRFLPVGTDGFHSHVVAKLQGAR